VILVLKPLSRDSWLAIGLFVALAAVMLLVFARQQRTVAPPLSSSSNQADGARALWLWLEELGYTPSNHSGDRFNVPDEAKLLLLLEPTEFVHQSEWAVIDRWVEAGGLLIVAGDRYLLTSWADHYRFRRMDWRTQPVTPTLYIQNPLFLSPPIGKQPSFALEARGALTSTRDDFVVHAALNADPLIVSFVQGQGRVILSVTAYPFSNSALRAGEGAPELVLNLVSLAGPPGLVWFDEWHHGVRSQRASSAPVGIANWLRSTTAGRAILFALAVVFVALLLRGRNFGRPVPLPQQLARRTPLEYVTAIANLHRRAGHREAIMQDYHLRLKRELGRRYRLDPRLPDADFVAQLAVYNPNVDQGDLLDLLQSLAAPTVSEQELVLLAGDVADWLKR
jgi:hypothetical protein